MNEPITGNLSDTCVGHVAGKATFNMEIKGGSVHVLLTGILFTGLRGLSNLIDQMFRKGLVPLLEHRLECIAGCQTRRVGI
ncbi:MAG: hypothetical protein VYA59_01985 [Pseudomonadota bacterium]|nr:hypothetical protein [Pseudomonadota bacterium]